MPIEVTQISGDDRLQPVTAAARPAAAGAASALVPRLAAELAVRCREEFGAQQLALTYRHVAPIEQVLHAEAGGQPLVRWDSRSSCLELTLHLLLALATSDGPAMVSEAIRLRSYLGRVEAVDATPPPVALQQVAIDPADPARLTGTLLIPRWACLVRRQAQVEIAW